MIRRVSLAVVLVGLMVVLWSGGAGLPAAAQGQRPTVAPLPRPTVAPIASPTPTARRPPANPTATPSATLTAPPAESPAPPTATTAAAPTALPPATPTAAELPRTSRGVGGGHSWPLALSALLLLVAAAIGALRRVI